MANFLNTYGAVLGQIATFLLAAAALINSFSTRKDKQAQAYLTAIENRVALLEKQKAEAEKGKEEAEEERDLERKKNLALESQNIKLMQKLLNLPTNSE